MMPCAQDDPVEILREALSDLPDAAVRGSVEELVRGILTGFVAELAANVDNIVVDATEAIIDQLAARAETPPTAAEPELRLVPAPSLPKRHQDSAERTCGVCGRVGTRRFTETETGWRCSPSATKCPGNKPAASTLRESRNDAPREPVADSGAPEHVDRLPDPLPAVMEIRKAMDPTAHCQDCNRTWTLTGVPLQTAVEQHELRKSHIVKVTAS